MDRADGRARRRIPRWLLRSVAVAVALLVGLLCYQLVRTALALRAAQSEVVTLQAALTDRDLAAAEAGAGRLAQHAAVARDSSDGILWRAVTWLPFVGDDADAVRSVARALDEVAVAAPQGLDLVRVVEDEDLRTTDGRIRLDLVERLGPGAQQLATATGRAAASVAPIDTASLLPPAAGPVRDFLDRLDRLDSAAVGLASATRVLPVVLGGEGTSRYLLVVQNNAEVRATGGLPGSFAELVARDGRLRIGFQGSSGDVMGDGSPVAPFAPGEEQVFGPLLVTDFRDTTFTPQFPRAAELMADFVERARPGTELDGVVVLDPVTLARILDVTGPVDVGGTQLRGDDAVATLLFDAYQDIDGDRAQDRFFQAAARATLDAVLGSDAELPSLVGPLQGAVEQRRLLLWSRDGDVQDAIEGLSVAGALPTGTGRPEVGIFINSGTASKMQYFLRSSYAVESLGCRDDGRQLVEVRATFANTLDRPTEELSDYVTGLGDAVPGEQRLRVRVFAPEAGELVGLDVDGARVPAGQAEVYDRQVTQFSVSALPGEQVRVVARLLGPPDQTAAPRLRWTPGVTWAPTEQVALPRC